MARVNYGPGITELKGSIGGVSFQRNNSGTIAKLRSVLVRNPSSRQSIARLNFNVISVYWASISYANKLLWNAFALANVKFNYWNVSKVLTGFNWFFSINANRYLTGQSFLDAPPVYATPLSCPEFVTLPFSGSLSFTFDSFVEKDSYYLFVYATPPLRSMNIQSRKSLRLISVINPAPVIWHDITSDWETYFNISWPPASTSEAFNILLAVSCVHKDTGIAGQFFLSNASLDVTTNPDLIGSSVADLGQQFSQSQIQTVLYLENGISVAGSYASGYTLRSTDYGATWSNLGAQTANAGVYASCGCGNGIVLQGTGNTGHIIRSTDYGATWSDLGNMFGESFVYVIGYLGNGICLAGTASNQKVLRSTDYGATWSDLGSQTTGFNIRSFCSCGNGVVLMGSGSGGGYIIRSTDYGATWSDLGNMFGMVHIYQLLYIGDGICLAGAGTPGHLLRSTDYGATWSDIGQLFSQNSLKSLEYLGFGVVVGGMGAGGILIRSTDYGATWSNLGQQGTETSLLSITKNYNKSLSFGTQMNGHIFSISQ